MKKISEDSILKYIEDHLLDYESTEDFARQFGYSGDHFRHLFRIYYDVSLGEYIRRRRLVHAASMIQEGKQIVDICSLCGFDTAAGFAKAFKKEFGFPASELKKQQIFLLDSVPEPIYDRDMIRVSIVETKDLRVIGRPLLPAKENGYDLLNETAYCLEAESCNGTLRKNVDEQELLKRMGAYKQDQIAMWYHEEHNQEIMYVLGPVVKNFDYIPSGMIPIRIPGRKYAIFETRRDSDMQELAETIRMLCKYIFWEWVPANQIITDKMGFTFERYTLKKAAIYLPIL